MVILALFGIIYMLSDPLVGIMLIALCGGIIFFQAFTKKHGFG